MISNNQRFLTIPLNDNKVYFGLLGIPNSLLVDLERQTHYTNFGSSGKLELDYYAISGFNWINIPGSTFEDFLLLNSEGVSTQPITNTVAIRREIDEEKYGTFLVDIIRKEYYNGIRGWKKIITVYALQ